MNGARGSFLKAISLGAVSSIALMVGDSGLAFAQQQQQQPLPPIIVQPPLQRPVATARESSTGQGTKLRRRRAARRRAPANGVAAQEAAAAGQQAAAAQAYRTREGSEAQGYKPSTVTNFGPFGQVPILNVPYSVNVISADLLENIQAASPNDAFKISPVAQLQSPYTYNTQEAPKLRGFPATTFSVDGLRVGSTYGPIPIEAVDRIEILTGLTGFLYGGTDVGGMINYVLKKPTPVPYYSLTLGDYGNTSGFTHLDAGGPLDKEGQFGYRINIVGQDGTLPTDPQQFQRGVVSGAFDYNIAPGTTFEVLGLHNDTVLKGDGSSWINLSLPSGASLFNYKTVPNTAEYWNQPFTTQHEVDDRVEANIHSEINDIFTFRAAYAFERSWVGARYSSYQDLIDNSGDFTQTVSRSSPYTVNTDTAYGFVDAKFATGPIQHKLTMGAYGDQEAVQIDAGNTTTVTSEYNFNTAPVYTTPPNVVPSASSASYYGTPFTLSAQHQINYVVGDDIKFNDHWSALVGENYATIATESYNQTPPFSLNTGIDESKLTPTASLIFKPAPWISTYSTYSESLFAGAAVPISTAYTNSGAILPPYLAKEYEFGTKASVGGVLLTAAWFNLNKANQYAQSNPDGTLTEVQDGRQVHQGIELTAIGNIATGLRIFGGITVMSAKVVQAANLVDDNKVPISTAEQMAKVTLEYDLPFLHGLTLTGGVYYVGKQPADAINAVWIDPYVTEDIGLRYRTKLPTGQETIFRLNVMNLTNHQYWVAQSRLGDPRTIAFSGQIKF